MQSDPDVRYLLSGIEARAEMRAQQTVSLNLKKRLQERERQRAEQLARENSRRKAENQPAVASLDDIRPEDIPDVLLKQTTQILGDYVALDQADRALARNAGTR